MDANEMIRAVVDKHEQVYQGDRRYDTAIARMAAIDLGNIDDSDVEDIVESFLYGSPR